MQHESSSRSFAKHRARHQDTMTKTLTKTLSKTMTNTFIDPSTSSYIETPPPPPIPRPLHLFLYRGHENKARDTDEPCTVRSCLCPRVRGLGIR